MAREALKKKKEDEKTLQEETLRERFNKLMDTVLSQGKGFSYGNVEELYAAGLKARKEREMEKIVPKLEPKGKKVAGVVPKVVKREYSEVLKPEAVKAALALGEILQSGDKNELNLRKWVKEGIA